MTPEVISENVEDIFSPEQVQPFPKAPSRKIVIKGGKRENQRCNLKKMRMNENKKKLRKEKNTNAKKKNTTNNTRKIKPKKKPTKMSLLPTLNDLANAESVCIICFGKYSASRSGEEWVQCVQWQFIIHM